MHNDIQHMHSLVKFGANEKIVAESKTEALTVFVFDEYFIMYNVKTGKAKKIFASELPKLKQQLKTGNFTVSTYKNN